MTEWEIRGRGRHGIAAAERLISRLRPMEARNPDARAMRADPAPVAAEKPPSPWMQHTLWIADPSAAPVEYLAPLRELGFTQLCVRIAHGATIIPDAQSACERYIAAGWHVVVWSRSDQQYGKDERCDPFSAGETVKLAACPAATNKPFAHNIEIRFSDTDNKVYVETCVDSYDALCTYPGGMPPESHRYYQQAGVRVLLVQTFGETEPYGISMFDASRWGLSLGYEIVLPMVGTFRGQNGYADAMLQADALGSLPRHAYLTEQSGWRHMSGQGYEWEKLMAGVR